MSNKTPISKASSYQDIGKFWDEHDSTEVGDETNTNFDVNITSQRRYFPIDNQLSLKIKEVANRHGVSQETLLNLWVQEKITEIQSSTISPSLTRR